RLQRAAQLPVLARRQALGAQDLIHSTPHVALGAGRFLCRGERGEQLDEDEAPAEGAGLDQPRGVGGETAPSERGEGKRPAGAGLDGAETVVEGEPGKRTTQGEVAAAQTCRDATGDALGKDL